MLKRALLKFWLYGSLLWMLVAAGMYYMGFQEEIHIRPAGPDQEHLCADVPECYSEVGRAYLMRGAVAVFGVPVGSLAIGGALAWAFAGFPWPGRR